MGESTKVDFSGSTYSYYAISGAQGRFLCGLCRFVVRRMGGGPRVVYAFITGVHEVYGGSLRIYEGVTGRTGSGGTGVIA